MYSATPQSLNVQHMLAFHTAQFISFRGSAVRVIVTLSLVGTCEIDDVDETALPDGALSVVKPPLAPPPVLITLALFDMVLVNRG
jgi:hypothetical protein